MDSSRSNEPKRTVLACGTPVRLSSVDMYGFCGREKHPRESDVGFLGLVVSNVLCRCDEDYDPVSEAKNALGGTPVGEHDYVCYLVRSSDGRELELVDHEVEDISLSPALGS